MEQTNTVALYQNKVTDKKKIKFRYDYLLYGLLGFFMGQAELNTGFYTYSLIYWSLFTGYNRYLLLLVSITTGLGLVWSGDWTNSLYLLAGITGLLIGKLIAKITRINKEISAITISLTYLLFAFAYCYYHEAMLYEYLVRTGEGFIIYLMILLAREGKRCLAWKQKRVPGLARLTLLLVSSGFIIGLANNSIITDLPFSIINILLLLTVVGAAIASGYRSGVLMAVLYGLILVGVGIIPIISMVKYIIFALITGIFKKRGKVWLVISLFLALLLYSGFSPTIYDLRASCIEVIISGIILLVIPMQFWNNIFLRFNEQVREKRVINVSGKKYNGLFKHQFQELGSVFAELSVTFKEVISDKEDNLKRINDFIYLFKNKNCTRCQRRKICWHHEKQDTYKKMRSLVKAGVESGNLNKKILEKYLKDKCPYYKKITGSIKSCFELFQVNRFWRNKLIDKHQIISQQLAGISQIIEGFSDSSDLILNQEGSLEHIRKKFNEHKIDVYKFDINSSLNRKNQMNISLEMEPCAGNNPCQKQLLDLINSEYECNFRILQKQCGNKLKDKPCLLEFSPVGDYKLEVMVLQKSVDGNVSGDSYLYKPLEEGKDLIVLSDGMGIGEEAARESKAAVNLFESIIEAGFNLELAIKTINSALFLRNQEERFTTLDIAFFDTFSGKLNFKKIGAVSSFIKRGWDVIEVKSSSVPAGILENIEISSHSLELKKNDFVVMLSDGVLDARTEIKAKEEWFKQLLRNTSFDKSEEFARYIMEAVTDKLSLVDDMTVIVFKVK